MSAQSETEKIFELENDPGLLDYVTYDGVPIWMMARQFLLYNVVSQNTMSFTTPTRTRKIEIKILPCVLKTILSNICQIRRLKKAQIVLYSTNRETIIDGKFFNRYVDQLFAEYPVDSFVVEQPLLDWTWPSPRINNKIYYDTLARINGEIQSKLPFHNRDKQQVSRMLGYFNNRFETMLGTRLDEDTLKYCEKHIVKLIVSMRSLSKWFAKRIGSNTKLVIAVGAGFPYYYFFNKELKKKKIVVAELQHGYITKNNIMYSYGNKIVDDSRVKKGLPDYFLTYGSWWNEQFNCPTSKVVLGNPYHEYCIKKNCRIKNDKDIVIIGIGQNTREYIKLTEAVARLLPDRIVRFRPHPGELPFAKDIITEEHLKIVLDDRIEIYETLIHTAVVISEVSTVLFEAFGIVDRIIVWSTKYSKEYLPVHPFESFETIEELVHLIESRAIRNTDYSGTQIWEKDWQKRYHAFVEDTITQTR